MSSSMHDIRDYKMKDYVKILLIVMVISGFINTVAAAPSLSNSGGGSWKYYKEITIRENSGSVLTDYQIPISISSNNSEVRKETGQDEDQGKDKII